MLLVAGALVVAIVISIALPLLLQIIKTRTPLPDLPWVGLKQDVMFSKARATYDSISTIRSMITDGYQKVGSLQVHVRAQR